MAHLEFRVGPETLRGELVEPPGRARAPLVVLSHGLSSCRREWFEFPARLAREGYAVLAFDYRGHGESDGERGFQSRARASADLAAAIEAGRKSRRVDGDRVALLGHSLGAALALCAAPDLPVRCLIAMAPPWRLRKEMSAVEFAAYSSLRLVHAPLLWVSKRGLKVPYKVDYDRLYASPEAVARARRERFLDRFVPMKNYRTLVQDLDAVEAARRVHVPTLVLLAEKDRVVQHASSLRVYGALAGPKSLARIPGSGHSMCGDAQSDLVATQSAAFFKQHLSGARR